jgi:hypothetical protein
MNAPRPSAPWAPRVERAIIRRLYQADARGVIDEELIDEAGYALLARCESITAVTEAWAGRTRCWGCAAIIEHDGGSHTVLRCAACGWQITWSDCQRSYQGKQLVGGSALPAFREFTRAWSTARTPRAKMLIIDTLLHACHGDARVRFTRPAAVNVIEGTARTVLAFLDELAYSDLSTPGLAATHTNWQDTREAGRRDWEGRPR